MRNPSQSRDDRPPVPGIPTVDHPGAPPSPGQATTPPPTTVDFCASGAGRPAPPPTAEVVPAVPGYDILGVLGRGGMGVVYKARHRQLKRLVALKMIRNSALAGEQERARFRTEAEAAARLQHPHILQIYEVGESDSLPFLTLEYAEGGSLSQKLRGMPQPSRQAAELVEVLAQAMAAAHQAGIVHRDLKPANVLLARDGTPKITDFGLAKKLDDDSGQTQAGAIMGSPSYMAPEQASGQTHAAGPAADVYALGAILYECLTGRPPFQGATILETLEQVRSQEPVPVRRLQPRVDRDLETICLKCLEKDPQRRYAGAEALALDLRRFLNGEPTVARPVGVRERLAKWARRRPMVATLSAGLFLAVVLGFSLVTWQWLRAETGWKQAETAKAEAVEAARGEAFAHQEADRERDHARGLAARMALARAQTAGEEGDSGACLLWLARSLTLAPAGDEPLRQVIRTNLDAWRRAACPLRAVLEHQETVAKVDVSADGRKLVTASRGLTRVWDAATGEPVGRPLVSPGAFFQAWSPDGSTVLVGGGNELPRFLDPATGQPVGKPLPGGLLSRAGGPSTLQSLPRPSLSPDGRTALTQSRDGTVRLWRAPGGEPFGPPPQGVLTNFHDVVFSPDGKTFLTASRDGRAGLVQVWETETTRPLGDPLRFPGLVHLVGFSPDSKVFLTYTADAQGPLIQEWETATRKPVGDPMRAHAPGGFSPDGKTYYTRSRAPGVTDPFSHPTEVQLWDTATARPCGHVLSHPAEVLAVDVSPDGRTVLTGCHDGGARLWEASSGQPLGQPFPYPSPVSRVAFSPDGRTFLLVSNQRTAGLGDVAGTRLLAALAHPGPIGTAVYTRDGKAVLTAGDEGTARLWGTPEGLEAGPPLPAPGVNGAWLSEDGALVVTSEWAGPVRLWDVCQGKPIGGPLLSAARMRAVALSRDGRCVAMARVDNPGLQHTLLLWDTATGQPLGRPLPLSNVNQVVLSPDGRVVLVSLGREASLHELETGRSVAAAFSCAQGINVTAFRPDGKAVLIAGQDGVARLLDSSTGQPIGDPLRHGGRVYTAVFTRDGRLLVTGSADKTARLWDGFTGKPISEPLHHQGGVVAAAFSPDGRTLLTGSGDKTARLWRTEDGRPQGPPFRHRGGVGAVAFSPNGRVVATGGQDRAVRLWDVATGQQLGPLLAHPGGVERLVFSPDGREVVASGYVGADAVRLMRFGPEGNVGEWTMTVRRWAVPGRWEGEDKGVESWAAAVTGMELDVHDNVVVLDKAGWEDRRKQSQERGNR